MNLLRVRKSVAAPTSRGGSPADGRPALAQSYPPAGFLVGFDERSNSCATRLQRLARGKSARKFTRQLSESLGQQRVLAMSLLSSELQYLNQLTELRESFEVPLRAAPFVPADAPSQIFATTPDLVALHRSLIDALEAFAAGIDGARMDSARNIASMDSPRGGTSRRGQRRLAALLLSRVPQLSEHYLRYARQWATGAEHALRGIEANARCAELIGAYGEGGGGSSRCSGARDGSEARSGSVGGAALGAAGPAGLAGGSIVDVSDHVSGCEIDPFPTAPLGFGGSRLRSLLQIPLERIAV